MDSRYVLPDGTVLNGDGRQKVYDFRESRRHELTVPNRFLSVYQNGKVIYSERSVPATSVLHTWTLAIVSVNRPVHLAGVN